MSAAEIIKEIKALPAEEQAKVAEFLHNFRPRETAQPQVRYIDPDKAQSIADKIFEENADLFRKLAE